MVRWQDYRPERPEDVVWDAVIVGTGMGGSVAGLALARRGLKVLFLEAGEPSDPYARARSMMGLRKLLAPATVGQDQAAMGRWRSPVSLKSGRRTAKTWFPMGAGPGGSSIIYAATLERFRREDLEPAGDPDSQMTSLPNDWPISYDELLVYYREAEALLDVRGARDPTDPDDDLPQAWMPGMSQRAQRTFDVFDRAGLSPHRMRMGVEYRPGCAECFGRACPRGCKNDAASRALQPALQQHGARMITGCRVERLISEGGQVRQVVASIDGRPLKLQGRQVILAAGALMTPGLLRASATADQPTGLGNAHDLLGRGLMFHGLQIFASWIGSGLRDVGPTKTLSSRELNAVDGVRVGGVQTFARRVSPSQIRDFVERRIEQIAPPLEPLAGFIASAAGAIGAPLFRDAILFAALTEDFAYRENRVVPAPDEPLGLAVEYAATPGLRARAALMRHHMSERLKGERIVFLSAGPVPNLGHACGTCRFGRSPQTSVLAPDNRVWGMDNLYVTDASFFPSSAATNPSLTIAANALRVADLILSRADMAAAAAQA